MISAVAVLAGARRQLRAVSELCDGDELHHVGAEHSEPGHVAVLALSVSCDPITCVTRSEDEIYDLLDLARKFGPGISILNVVKLPLA